MPWFLQCQWHLSSLSTTRLILDILSFYDGHDIGNRDNTQEGGRENKGSLICSLSLYTIYCLISCPPCPQHPTQSSSLFLSSSFPLVPRIAMYINIDMLYEQLHHHATILHPHTVLDLNMCQ